MRTIITVALTLLAAGGLLAQVDAPATAPESAPEGAPEADAGSTGYAVGYLIGQMTRTGLGNDGMGVDLDLVAKGLGDALSHREPMVSRNEMDAISLAVDREMEGRRVRRLLDESPEFKALYDANLDRSRRFLELFAAQPGVVSLPSGACYLVLKPGIGSAPGPDDTVVAKVKATMLDRSVINDGTEPVEIRVRDSIPGGVQILQLMRPGAQWQVVLPPELAFGAGGRPPDIGPNEAIVTMVELLEVKRAPRGGRR